MTKIENLSTAILKDYAEVIRLDKIGNDGAADRLQRAANRNLPKIIAIRSSLPSDWQAKARVLHVLGGQHDALQASILADMTAAAA